MNPRLWYYMGQWHCQSMRLECLRVGIGYTPEEAYRDWEAM